MVGAPLFFPLDGQTKGGVVVGTIETLGKKSKKLGNISEDLGDLVLACPGTLGEVGKHQNSK